MTFADVFDDKPQQAVVEIGPGASSLELLQAIYRSPHVPLSTRMRAASMAIPFEHPKLGVTVNVNDDGSFAARLDAAIQRSTNGHAKVEKVEGPVIEHSPSEMREPMLPMPGALRRRI
jgi:hypothetical protein